MLNQSATFHPEKQEVQDSFRNIHRVEFSNSYSPLAAKKSTEPTNNGLNLLAYSLEIISDQWRRVFTFSYTVDFWLAIRWIVQREYAPMFVMRVKWTREARMNEV
jgi:hypothetical protein